MRKNIITRTTELAMSITLEYVSYGDTVVDATCGTGQDTVSLARSVGDSGRVYAFDIQQEALRLTEARLKEAGLSNVQLIHESYASLGSYVPEGSAAAVVFNLGYLPGGDHSITTTSEVTLEGLDAALRTIRTDGIVTVVMYDGHEEGAKEKAAVLEWAERLDSGRYHVAYVSMLNQKNNPPEIVWITKKK